MNKVELLGRLTRDPEIRYSQQSQQQLAIARFSVAVNRRVSSDQQQTADFISCVAFGKAAETIERYFHRGNQIGVVGHIQTGSYVNRDGQKVYTTDVVVDDFDFVDPKGVGDSPVPHPAMAEAPKPATARSATDWVKVDEVNDAGLPFN